MSFSVPAFRRSFSASRYMDSSSAIIQFMALLPTTPAVEMISSMLAVRTPTRAFRVLSEESMNSWMSMGRAIWRAASQAARVFA